MRPRSFGADLAKAAATGVATGQLTNSAARAAAIWPKIRLIVEPNPHVLPFFERDLAAVREGLEQHFAVTQTTASVRNVAPDPKAITLVVSNLADGAWRSGELAQPLRALADAGPVGVLPLTHSWRLSSRAAIGAVTTQPVPKSKAVSYRTTSDLEFEPVAGSAVLPVAELWSPQRQEHFFSGLLGDHPFAALAIAPSAQPAARTAVAVATPDALVASFRSTATSPAYELAVNMTGAPDLSRRSMQTVASWLARDDVMLASGLRAPVEVTPRDFETLVTAGALFTRDARGALQWREGVRDVLGRGLRYSESAALDALFKR